jgi:1-acyl-sn-glycerol-3-phosphate acyltransferase
MSMPESTVHFSPRLPFRYRLFRRFLMLAGAVLFRIRMVGKENIPGGNYVVVGNHLNWIDPFLLMIALPAEPRLYFIGARQIVNRRWKRWLMENFDGMIVVDRGAGWVGRDIFSKPLQVLECGAVLGLFPEGNVGHAEGTLEPLQHGIGHFLLHAQGNYPVLPVALSGVKELYWRKPLTVTFGKPFHVHAEGANQHVEVENITRQVENALHAVIPPYEEPVVAHKRMRFLTNLLG